MKTFIKEYWKTLAFFAAVGLVGGFFVGLYMLDSYPADIRQMAQDQGITNTVFGAVTAVQSAGYGLILGTFGIFLGKRTGLWKDERRIEKKPLMLTIALAIICGAGLILPDLLFFGKHSQVIADSYAAKPSIPLVIATVTYAAVIEEVMIRLFTMSLVAFVIHLVFRKKYAVPTVGMFVSANIISAILFAAGHLPATALMMGLTPMIVFRCFLLNGALGLIFGFLYRKYGLRYAMIAHGGCHIVSKLIWLLFI